MKTKSELLCLFVKSPNKITLKAIKDAEKGKGLTASKDVKDLFKKLGIQENILGSNLTQKVNGSKLFMLLIVNFMRLQFL